MTNQALKTQDWLADRVVASPDAEALIFDGQRWTYAELDEATDVMSRQLLAMSIQPGAYVGVLMFNRFEYVCLIHALARIGAVLVPFNTRLTASELEGQRSHVDCSVVICDAAHESTATQMKAVTYSVDAPRHPSTQRLSISYSGPTTNTLCEEGIAGGDKQLFGATHERAQTASDYPEEEPPDVRRTFSLDNLQAIVFTSGTTGAPKGVMLSFSNHFWSATASAFRLGLVQEDRWLSCIPLYHVGGLSVVFRSCLYGTSIDLHPRFDVETIYQNLNSTSVTLISLVPTMLVRLVARFDDDDGQQKWPASLRHVLVGGAAAAPELLAQCLKRSIPISTTYGLTEVGSQAVTLTPTDAAQKVESGGQVGSVGKPLMFNHVRVVERADDGSVLAEAPVNCPGEIVVRGPTVMQGYYNNPEATERTLIQTEYGIELFTGDIGYLDDDGDLWVLQRRSDMIVSGGENIYPSEVEAVLRSHPDILDVCVVGLPDTEWGQVVAAMVVSSAKHMDDYRLLYYAREKLARYKLPRQLRFVDELPQTASGKVHRRGVAAAFSEDE